MFQKNGTQSNNHTFKKPTQKQVKQTSKYTIEKLTVKQTEQPHVSKTSVYKNIFKNIRKNISLQKASKTSLTKQKICTAKNIYKKVSNKKQTT